MLRGEGLCGVWWQATESGFQGHSQKGAAMKRLPCATLQSSRRKWKESWASQSLEFEGNTVLGPWSSLLPAPKNVLGKPASPADIYPEMELVTISESEGLRPSQHVSLFPSGWALWACFLCPEADLERSRSESCLHCRHPGLHASFFVCSDLALYTHEGCEGFRSEETRPFLLSVHLMGLINVLRGKLFYPLHSGQRRKKRSLIEGGWASTKWEAFNRKKCGYPH